MIKQATIIIAAHNEESTIRATLTALGGGRSSNFTIMVVCNGCVDNTETIVRKEFPEVVCESLNQASKANAIRHAESLGIGFPRVYLDADIQLSQSMAEHLIRHALHCNNAALVIPRSHTLLEGCNNAVKRFYQVWYETPYVKLQGFGAGCYVLNQTGRARFGEWPDLIADDGFVRTQFASHEITINQYSYVTVKAPKSLWSLLKVKARSKYGNLQLRDHQRNNTATWHQYSAVNLGQSSTQTTLNLFIYLVINSLAASMAKWHKLTGSFLWHRDNSNRS